MPEANPTGGLITVLKGKNFLGAQGTKYEGDEFDGFYIIIKVDRRYYDLSPDKEHYTVTVRSNNELMVKMPAWSFDFLNERDELESILNENKMKGRSTEPGLLKAVDHAHSVMESSEEAVIERRKYIYLCLKFDKGIELSGEELHPNFSDKLMLPIEGTLKFSSGNRFFYYKVARLDTESMKSRKKEKKNKSEGASMFEDSPEKNVKMQQG